jgi:formylglycine-generating enzyme required for sulfatase activity
MLQATEVTVGQFKTFVEATSYRTYAEFSDGAKVFKGPQSTAVGLSPWEKRQDANWRNPYYFQDDACPVVAVDWNDIQTFLVWLNQIDPGKGYRLPTEAEWDFASRGGAEDAWLGDPDDQAWHAGNSGSHAHAVARRVPNAYGLYDMLGNVWEWCQDWYSVPFAGPFPRVDPRGPGEGDKKAIKGTSWATPRTHVQWINREGRYPEECFDDLGFRLAADVP